MAESRTPKRRGRPPKAVVSPPVASTAGNAYVTVGSYTSGTSAANLKPSSGPRDLGKFAAQLALGPPCERGCGNPATWGASAPHRERFGCDEHLAGLLDRNFVWFLHSVSA